MRALLRASRQHSDGSPTFRRKLIFELPSRDEPFQLSSIQNRAAELSGKHSKFIDQFLELVLSRS